MFVRAVSESFPKDGVVKTILDDTISAFLAGASDREGGGQQHRRSTLCDVNMYVLKYNSILLIFSVFAFYNLHSVNLRPKNGSILGGNPACVCEYAMHDCVCDYAMHSVASTGQFVCQVWHRGGAEWGTHWHNIGKLLADVQCR